MTSDHVQQRIVLLLTDVHAAARSGDWFTVREKTEQVLRLNPFNHDARAYWSLAKNGGATAEDSIATEINSHLETVHAALETGDWHALVEGSERILDLDPGHAEALRYVEAAREAMSARSRSGKRKIGARPPAVATDKATSNSHPYAKNDALSTATAGLIAALSLFHLLAAGFYLWGAGIVGGLDSGESTFSESRSFDDNATIVAILLVVGFVACAVLYLFWLHREVTSTRAMGLRTWAPPSISIGVSFLLGMLGSYAVLRDLAARLRGRASLAGEGILLAWLVAGVAGVALSGMVTKQPVDNAEWADLLRLTAFASLALAAAGLCLAYSIRRTHELLSERSLAPERAPRTDAPVEVAA